MKPSTKRLDTQGAKDIAYRLLSARSHSICEIRRKLKRRGAEDATIADVISQLQVSGYLDDRAFSELYVQGRIAHKAYGRRWFFHSLLRRGIDKEIIEETLDRIFNEISERDLASQAAASKLQKLGDEDPRMRAAKVARFLRSRGFNEGVIMEIVNDQLTGGVEVEHEDGE
ncbi:regulatory protein RecX [bacterium]|nr:regulatory protein RecX [bacterium]